VWVAEGQRREEARKGGEMIVVWLRVLE